ncbi:hypothetical protein EP7_005232 [Isosphaeraceae bacterium EP7]
MERSSLTDALSEAGRRLPKARGTPVLLADGGEWMLARPRLMGDRGSLSEPDVDDALDRIFDGLVLGEPIDPRTIRVAARSLLRPNYDLSEAEAESLVAVPPGPPMRALAATLVESLFGARPGVASFTGWARASLQANGLGGVSIDAGDLSPLLAVLSATGRTIPLADFADVCRDAEERIHLESLV